MIIPLDMPPWAYCSRYTEVAGSLARSVPARSRNARIADDGPREGWLAFAVRHPGHPISGCDGRGCGVVISGGGRL